MYKCTEADRGRILDYISAEPEMNLFIFGDIENFGLEGGPVRIYAVERGDEWDSLLLQYFDFYILYSRDVAGCDVSAVAAFFEGRRMDCVSGKTELIERLAPYFPALTVQSDYMTRCVRASSDAVRPLPEGFVLRRCGVDDLPATVGLLSIIEEFSAGYREADAIENEIERTRLNMEHGSLVYGVFHGDELVCTASTSAANSQSAMVVGVATRPGFRGRGFATAAVAELCRASFEDGKKFLCLFYDNPNAGRIYRRIGFEELGKYAMLR